MSKYEVIYTTPDGYDEEDLFMAAGASCRIL